ncbi:MAG: thermonuclease family protein [Sphingomonadaceae bacterium]
MKRTLALALLVFASPTSAQPVSGEAAVIDGDTLLIGDEKIRLFGIDAPELDQECSLGGKAWACGQEAASQLRSITAGQIVNCTEVERDQHSRLVAVCSAAGYDLGATMVEYGWAVAFRRYSTNYVAHEHRAKAAKAGIWRSDFILPQVYRSQRDQESEPQSSAEVTGCVIKGNRSRRGDWIYHVPGQQYYEQTRPEEIFCSETAARAAGYRRSKR